MQLTPHTDSHAAHSGAARREERTLLGAQAKPLYSQMALSRKPFGMGHMFIQTFLLRMTDTMTSQNVDLSSWDTLYIYAFLKRFDYGFNTFYCEINFVFCVTYRF
jgi:hypothetical protein